jgi:hypothetical protein
VGRKWPSQSDSLLKKVGLLGGGAFSKNSVMSGPSLPAFRLGPIDNCPVKINRIEKNRSLRGCQLSATRAPLRFPKNSENLIVDRSPRSWAWSPTLSLDASGENGAGRTFRHSFDHFVRAAARFRRLPPVRKSVLPVPAVSGLRPVRSRSPGARRSQETSRPRAGFVN